MAESGVGRVRLRLFVSACPWQFGLGRRGDFFQFVSLVIISLGHWSDNSVRGGECAPVRMALVQDCWLQRQAAFGCHPFDHHPHFADIVRLTEYALAMQDLNRQVTRISTVLLPCIFLLAVQ